MSNSLNPYANSPLAQQISKMPMSEEVYGVVECGRWAPAERLIRDAAWRCGHDVRIDVERHYLRKSVRWKLYGKGAKGASDAIDAALRARDKGEKG